MSDAQAQPKTVILRRRDLEARLGIKRSTIYDKLDPRSPRYDVSFPKPVTLGVRSVGWVEAEVEAWLRQRIGASRAAAKARRAR